MFLYGEGDVVAAGCSSSFCRFVEGALAAVGLTLLWVCGSGTWDRALVASSFWVDCVEMVLVLSEVELRLVVFSLSFSILECAAGNVT